MSGTMFLQTLKPDLLWAGKILERLKRASNSWRRARNMAIRRAEAAIKEGKLRERGEEERMSQGRRKKKMAGREPVKRWGSINQEVNLLLMVMLQLHLLLLHLPHHL